MLRLALATILATSGCSSPENGGPLRDGAPFWSPINIEGAPDLGHTPQELASVPAIVESTLRDVTNEAGLGASVAGGNTHGVGVAFLDLNGDGFADILTANGIRNNGGTEFASELWINDAAGSFTNATQASGIGGILTGFDTYSVAAADYDADGDVDVYVTAQPRDFLLQNDGFGNFSDVTAASAAGGPESAAEEVSDGRSKIAAWGDFDADGWLDVAVASSTLPSPDAYLLRNLGDGTFEDISVVSEITDAARGNACAVLWTDYDDDADQDLWIWNDRGGHVLLRNDDGVFLDVSADASSVDIGNPMGIDGADIDHDLDLDYYVSNAGHNPLLRNNSDGTFTDIGREAGTDGPSNQFGWGLGFEDFNLDTWPDIFVAQEDDRDHLVFTHNGDSPPTWDYSAFAHEPVSGGAHNVAAAFADYDNDGRVDVVAAGTSGTPLTLYRNETDVGDNTWLEVRVSSVPDRGGVGGVTARVAVKTGELVQFREITGGTSRASSNELSVRFGLGAWSGAEWVAVQWPDGRSIVRTGVAGNQRLELEP